MLRRFIYSIFVESTGTPVYFIIFTNHDSKVSYKIRTKVVLKNESQGFEMLSF